MEQLHDACGIVGIYMSKGQEDLDVRRYITLALTALQHQEQESAGMAVYNSDGQIVHRAAMGKVRKVFTTLVLVFPLHAVASGMCATLQLVPVVLRTLALLLWGHALVSMIQLHWLTMAILLTEQHYATFLA